jgi:hypothetical protein
MPMYRMFCSEFVAVCYQARDPVGCSFSLQRATICAQSILIAFCSNVRFIFRFLFDRFLFKSSSRV